MIYDKLSNLGRYKGLSTDLDRAIHFLQTEDLAALPLGRTEIDGERVYLNRFVYNTEGEEAAQLETHRRHLDIHIAFTGREGVDLAPAELLGQGEYHEAEEYEMIPGKGLFKLPLLEGYFVLVYPGEAHMPKVHWDGSAEINKLVVKIEL